MCVCVLVRACVLIEMHRLCALKVALTELCDWSIVTVFTCDVTGSLPCDWSVMFANGVSEMWSMEEVEEEMMWRRK